MKAALKLFLIGAVAGTLLDYLQTRGGIAYYTDPFWMETAWWVPFLFGGAVVLVGWSHFKLHPMPQCRPIAFWGSLIFLICACVVTAFAATDNATKGLILVWLYLLSWGFFDRSIGTFALALVTGLIGPAFESFLGKLDLYYYTSPDFFGFPIWLPFLYWHLSQTVGHLGRQIFKRQISH